MTLIGSVRLVQLVATPTKEFVKDSNRCSIQGRGKCFSPFCLHRSSGILLYFNDHRGSTFYTLNIFAH